MVKLVHAKVLFALLMLAVIFGCGGAGGGNTISLVKYVFVGNRSDSSISRYMVTPAGGLSSLGTATPTTNDPYGLAVTPNGDYLYSASSDGEIDQFSVETNGDLTPLSPANVPLSNGNYGIAITPDGKYLFATSTDDVVYQYVIGVDGKLTPNATPTVATGDYPAHIIISEDGAHAYVSNYDDDSISCYTVNANGTLTANGPVVSGTMSGPWSIAMNDEGTLMYVANSLGSTIAQFSVAANGTLTPLTPATIAAANGSYSVAVPQVGNYVFSAAYDTDVNIRRYVFFNGIGTLNELTPALLTGQTSQWPIQFSPQNLMYVCNQGADSVSVYSMAPNGSLTLVETVAAGDVPASLAFVKY